MYENIWKKRVLVPLWVVQLVFACLVLVLASFGLGTWEADKYETHQYYSEEDERTVDKAVKIGAGVYIAFSAITIVFDVAEIIMFARNRLSPVVAVVLNSITSLAWLVIFILALVAAITSRISVFGFVFYLVIAATCKGKLLYAAIILHRWRKGTRARGAYTPAVAPESFDPSHTAYNSTGAPPNPFRDPSPVPHGTAAPYYATNAHTAAPFQYEMQQQPLQQDGARYA